MFFSFVGVSFGLNKCFKCRCYRPGLQLSVVPGAMVESKFAYHTQQTVLISHSKAIIIIQTWPIPGHDSHCCV